MAYFSKGSTRHKLMILYFLREINCEITRDELFRVFAEQGWMDYFDFQSALTELEEDAYVAAVPCTFGQGYRVAAHGEDSLNKFEQELPFSIREKMKNYIDENGDILRDRRQFSAFKTQMPSGGYAVIMRLMEKNSHLLDITLKFPDAKFAQIAVEQWPKKAEQVYKELLGILCEPED